MILSSVLSLILLLQNLASPPVQALGSVQGTVIEFGTGRPLKDVTVQLRTSGGVVGFISTNTRDDGSFTMRNVPPGAYAIQASRGGYVTEAYGTRRTTDQREMPIQEIALGQNLSGIRITLTPGAVIYGRIIDDRGEVVVGATVQALKTTFKNGLRERSLIQTAISNDLGEYRLFMLRPGEYFINAMEVDTPLLPTPRGTLAIPTYFPGTIDPKEAQPIVLRVGENLGGVDFLSFPTRHRRVAGTIQGGGNDSMGVVLSVRNGTDFIGKSVDPDLGTFQFNDIVPGSYMLLARTHTLRSLVQLEVRNTDVLNARITLSEGYRIPVHVRIEGHPAGDDPDNEKLYFLISADPALPGLESDTYSPFADGKFALDLLDRDYRIELVRTEDYYVKSIKLAGLDVLNQGLHATNSSDTPLEIVVAQDFGSVAGRVQGQGTVTVVLVPDAGRREQRTLYRSKQISSPGNFLFDKVPPGEYKLFAWIEENGGPWLDPEYLRKYEDRGIPVRIEAGKQTSLNRPLEAIDR